MKKIIALFLIALVSAFLVGCQKKAATVKAEEPKEKVEITGNGQLVSLDEIIKVEVSKTKGIDPVVYKEADELVIFSDLFASATREPGAVNVTDSQFYLKLTNKEGGVQRIYLWVGNKEEKSMLMDSEDTHTVYTVTTEMTEKLIQLIDK